jgi:hypothetical protein
MGTPKGDDSVRGETGTIWSAAGIRGTSTAHTACGRSGRLQRDSLYVCTPVIFSAKFGYSLRPAQMEQDRDPTVDPRRPVVVPDPRSGSIDPGSRNQPWTPFSATMTQIPKKNDVKENIDSLTIG